MPDKYVVIDLVGISKRLTGVERYGLEVTIQLLSKPNSGFSYYVLVSKTISVDILHKLQKSVRGTKNNIVQSKFSYRLLNEQLWIPFILCSKKIVNVAFFPIFPPGLLVWLMRGGIEIQHTVFDATMWVRPDTISWKNKCYMRPLENIGMARYDLIHTISDFSKKELVGVFPQVQPKIVNTGCGVDVDKFSKKPSGGIAELDKNNLVLPKEFMLFVGTLEPRKNLIFLVNVFKLFLNEQPDAYLVLAGRLGWGGQELLDEINRLGLCEKIRLLGAVSDDLLLSLYAKAKIFVFPSVYEGFGLPLVEAFAAGLPVVTSNAASLPEVSGKAAWQCAPDSQEDWLIALKEVWNNAKLSDEMIAEGKKQVRLFSWENVANKIEGCFYANGTTI